MTKQEELTALNENIQNMINEFKDVNEQCSIHIREHVWHELDARAMDLSHRIRIALRDRSELMKALNLPKKEKMKKCCLLCSYCEDDICIEHSRGYEAHIRYPKWPTDCKDFAFDEERAEILGVELENPETGPS